MLAELKGNYLGYHERISSTNGKTYYTADVYCLDGDTAKISIPAEMAKNLKELKKFSEVNWMISIINHPQYGLRVTLAE